MIEDGNAIIDNLKELSATFKDIYSKGFDIAVQRSDTIFITDMYIENSVKGMERKSRRGEIDRTPKKKPSDLKKFLSNDENKVQLIKMPCRTWKITASVINLATRNP